MPVIKCPSCQSDVRVSVTLSSTDQPGRVPAELLERVQAFLRTVEPGKYLYLELEDRYVAGGNPPETQWAFGAALKAAGAEQTRDSRARYYTVSPEIGKPEPAKLTEDFDLPDWMR